MTRFSWTPRCRICTRSLHTSQEFANDLCKICAKRNKSREHRKRKDRRPR